MAPATRRRAGQRERTDAGDSHYVNSSLGVSGITVGGGGATYYTRTPGGHLVGQRNASGAWYYYLFDGLGSVVGLVDASGNVVARYSYDPYGQTVTKTGAAADGNPFRYTGAYLDGTGLYKMGARYYDAARGRFTQLDPLGGGYIYASDNPINSTDPTGLYNEWTVAIAREGTVYAIAHSFNADCGCVSQIASGWVLPIDLDGNILGFNGNKVDLIAIAKNSSRVRYLAYPEVCGPGECELRGVAFDVPTGRYVVVTTHFYEYANGGWDFAFSVSDPFSSPGLPEPLLSP